MNIRVNGQLTYNSIYDCLDAAMAGLGVAYVPEDIALPYIRTGHLVSVMEDWCPSWSGYHLYYPSRRQPSGAMSLLIAALRYGRRPGSGPRAGYAAAAPTPINRWDT